MVNSTYGTVGENISKNSSSLVFAHKEKTAKFAGLAVVNSTGVAGKGSSSHSQRCGIVPPHSHPQLH